MGLGDTLSNWVGQQGDRFKAKVAEWAIGATVDATDAVAKTVEPQVLELVQTQIDTIRNMEGLSPELKVMLDKLVVPKNPAVLAGLIAFFIAFAANLANSVSKQALEPVMQQLAKLTPFHVPGLSEVLDLKLRRGMTDAEYTDLVGRTGWSKAWADRFYDLKHPTLPSEIALSASLRDPIKYKWAVDNLPRLGLTPADIELLTEMQWRVPGVQDIIRYVVKEAYDPATVAEFGQAEEYPGMAEADAAKTGVRPDQLMKEWISHWELPGVSQGYEMMHRGEITPEQLARLLKARDVMPFWRDKLTAISWSLPGRIETRMMALYGLIDKAGVVELLGKDGLAAEYRDIVADMNIVRGVKSDLQVRYTNGWINAQELQAEIAAQNLLPAIADQLYKSIVKNASAARTKVQKDLTLTQIEKGVKKGKLTRPEAITLIVDIGYDLQEATFLLAVDVPEDDTDAAVKARTLTKADILDGLKSAVFTRSQAVSRLVTARYTAPDAEYIVKVYEASIKKPTPEKVKEATRSDIENSVKLGLITVDQAYAMLIDLKYTPEAATFIKAVVVAKDTAANAQRRLDLARADIIGGLKSGVITETQALTNLAALGYTDADAAYIVNVYQASITVPEPAPPKEVSKADIIAAVKRGLITPEEGFGLLISIGYSDEAATFILSLVPESSPFSPLNYDEFKALTGSWRRSQGLTDEVLPPAAQELRLQQAQAVAEGREPVLETLRIQIDTIRRQRRSGALTREAEIVQLTALKVPADYLAAIVANDDARIAARK